MASRVTTAICRQSSRQQLTLASKIKSKALLWSDITVKLGLHVRAFCEKMLCHANHRLNIYKKNFSHGIKASQWKCPTNKRFPLKIPVFYKSEIRICIIFASCWWVWAQSPQGTRLKRKRLLLKSERQVRAEGDRVCAPSHLCLVHHDILVKPELQYWLVNLCVCVCLSVSLC